MDISDQLPFAGLVINWDNTEVLHVSNHLESHVVMLAQRISWWKAVNQILQKLLGTTFAVRVLKRA
jgi:hypothetical protein